jgi:cytochrome d ubiquinol oxidase subunit II
MSSVIAVVLLLALTAYAVFAGADFGAGFWDLVSGGAERGRRPRELIERSIGPVWEANHVWLIFVLVVTWTAFPDAYASIWLTLFVPLTIAALGIVLRGACFAFRKVVESTAWQRVFGAAFAISSVLVPYCMGTVAGGIASGRVPAGGRAGDPVESWVNPTSVLAGLLALAMFAYLSAAFLVWEARGGDADDLAEHFRRRCVGSAVAVAACLVALAFVVRDDAPYVWDGLTSRALPVVAVGALCGVGALVLLVRGAARGARVLAALAVAAVVIGWGAAQWDYLLPQSLTVSAAAAPPGTLQSLVVVVALAALLVVPGFGLLYVLEQRGLLPDEGVEEVSGGGP